MRLVPHALLDLGTLPLWWLVLLYAAIGAGIWSAHRSRADEEHQPRFQLPEFGSTRTRLWLGGVSIVALLVWLAVLSLPDGRLHVTVLDVGLQGDAIHHHSRRPANPH